MNEKISTYARHAATISNQTRTISDEAVWNIELFDAAAVVIDELVEIVTSDMMKDGWSNDRDR